MDKIERNKLVEEKDGLRIELEKAPFIDPQKVRRLNEITSLLLTDGKSESVRIIYGKMKKSKRVTSFTRDRR